MDAQIMTAVVVILLTVDFKLRTGCTQLCAGIHAKKNIFRDSLKKFLKLGKIKEMAITRPFFELHTPDFAWKFV